MRKSLLVTALLFLMSPVFCQSNQLPFTKGVNLLNYLDTCYKDQLPHLNKYDEADFACFKSMGIEVIRLPIHFDLVMEPYTTGKISDIILEKLDQVCDWAEKYQIYLIIDNHSLSTEEYADVPPSAKQYKEHLEAVWSQVAPRYKDRSQYIIYELMNEPKDKGDIVTKWIKIQQEIIELIRGYDPERDIVVTGTDFSNIDTLVKMKPYSDPHLIYTFHFYEPFHFTHQGVYWMDKTIKALKDIPFPYNKSRFPKLQGDAAVLTDYFQNQYKQEGTAKYINSRIKKVADWAKKNKTRVLCGELGVTVWTNPTDRLEWIKTTVAALNSNNIPYCTWGMDDSFGLLKSDDYRLFFPDDLDKAAVEATGLTMPDAELAEKAGCDISKDSPYVVFDGVQGSGVGLGFWGTVKRTRADNSLNDYMSVSYPGDSNGLRFSLPKKLSSKVADNRQSLFVSFKVKFANSNQEFRVHLMDSDGGEEALPWRKTYTVKASAYPVNKWVTVEIPISAFEDSYGTWSDKTQKWHSLPCDFDWARLESLYFDFDDYDNKNTGDILIDDIMITK